MSPDLPSSPIPPTARQLVCVLADRWSSTRGLLRRYVRDAGAWVPLGDALPVELGRAGLAWGLGLHRAEAGGPDKCEGDGRAPAGVFALTDAFGTVAADSDWARALRLPYRQTCGDLLCVDDPASCHYNALVDRRAVTADWASAETMRRDDERYLLGVTVAHNPGRLAGAGSCIFLHVRGGAGVPTAGCTAMTHEAMAALIAWLDAAQTPLLVQLPREAYAARRAAWGLPDIAAP